MPKFRAELIVVAEIEIYLITFIFLHGKKLAEAV